MRIGTKHTKETKKTMSIDRIGNRNSHWKGGKILKDGYVLIKNYDHPHRIKGKNYIREHRVIVERYLGRYLRENEVIHHVDRNKSNNNINNLIVFVSHKSHMNFEYHSLINTYDIILDGRNIKENL